jgi:hypothetical protein
MNVFAAGTQVDDRITNKLAQAMIGHLATAVRLKDRYVTCVELLFIEQN